MNKTKSMKPNKSRVSKITIGRLYNLGNYEHIRYEVTVDIAEGRSAATAMRNTIRLLKAVNPKPPVPLSSYQHAKSQLFDPQAWHKNIQPEKEREKAIAEMVKDAKATVKLWDKWVARSATFEALLDDIGATKVRKDAKTSWGDDDDGEW